MLVPRILCITPSHAYGPIRDQPGTQQLDKENRCEDKTIFCESGDGQPTGPSRSVPDEGYAIGDQFHSAGFHGRPPAKDGDARRRSL